MMRHLLKLPVLNQWKRTFSVGLWPSKARVDNQAEVSSKRLLRYSSSEIKRFSSHSNNADDLKNILSEDEELRSMLKDIMNDFDDAPQPPDGGKKNSQSLSENEITGDTDDNGDANPLSAETVNKYITFDKALRTEILDTNEETPDFYLYQEKQDKFYNVNKTRGIRGVFDLPELVATLREENMRDIVVIETPKSLSYCEHMIICTARSSRHLQAVAEFLRKLHKLKKSSKDDVLTIEGKDSRDWKAIDMGNIVLHLMLEEMRERYQIEVLWSAGEANDDLSQMTSDPLEDLLEQNIQYLDKIQSADRQ